VRGYIIERGREFYSLEQAVLEGREGEKERRREGEKERRREGEKGKRDGEVLCKTGYQRK